MKRLWYLLNGRKTLIGVFLGVVYSGLVAQNIIQRNEVVESLIFGITGVGLGHKIVKS